MNQLRKLWEQHVYWTRFFIISTAADLADLEPVIKRLLRNPGDFAAVLTQFYGVRLSNRFKDLFTQHLLIAADLVNAAKKQEAAKAEEAHQKWYANADDIAKFLADINPCWSETRWKAMLYDHLAMTEREAVLRLGGKYAEDIVYIRTPWNANKKRAWSGEKPGTGALLLSGHKKQAGISCLFFYKFRGTAINF